MIRHTTNERQRTITIEERVHRAGATDNPPASLVKLELAHPDSSALPALVTIGFPVNSGELLADLADLAEWLDRISYSDQARDLRTIADYLTDRAAGASITIGDRNLVDSLVVHELEEAHR